jgi:predicted DCC family thiol-disulfide oxidoreductase YuxK
VEKTEKNKKSGFAPEQPLLIYDGDCPFCRKCARLSRRLTGDRVGYEPSRSAGERLPQFDAQDFARAVQLVTPEGKNYSAAEAVFHTLDYVPGLGLPRWLYDHVPGFAGVSERVYRWVADRRRCGAESDRCDR